MLTPTSSSTPWGADSAGGLPDHRETVTFELTDPAGNVITQTYSRHAPLAPPVTATTASTTQPHGHRQEDWIRHSGRMILGRSRPPDISMQGGLDNPTGDSATGIERAERTSEQTPPVRTSTGSPHPDEKCAPPHQVGSFASGLLDEF